MTTSTKRGEMDESATLKIVVGGETVEVPVAITVTFAPTSFPPRIWADMARTLAADTRGARPPSRAYLAWDEARKLAQRAELREQDERAREFQERVGAAEAKARHAHRNQRYGRLHYTSHLADVVQVLLDAGETDPHIIAAGWLHDAIEDTGMLYAEIAADFGAQTANMVWAVTGEGKGRVEHARTAYRKIVELGPRAALLKLSDRIANGEACARGPNASPKLFRMYLGEHRKFVRMLGRARLGSNHPLLARLRRAFNVPTPIEAAHALLKVEKGVPEMSGEQARRVHDKCNVLLTKLRCGKRRWSARLLRVSLRSLRAKAAERMRETGMG